MDNKDMTLRAEKYKQEMMKLYSKSPARTENAQEKADAAVDRAASANEESAITETADMNIRAEAVPAVNVRPEANESPDAEEISKNEVITEVQTDRPDEIVQGIENRYPEPDLSGIYNDHGQLRIGENREKLGQYNEKPSDYNKSGFIIVNVRAGDQADPIENAVVHISSIKDESRYYDETGITDNSGTTRRFEVPAPSVSLSQAPDSKIRPYALYDISVTAKGYFNARSVDVPVFEGVTSVQTFSMIPLPLYMRSSEETVTYYNQEPIL